MKYSYLKFKIMVYVFFNLFNKFSSRFDSYYNFKIMMNLNDLLGMCYNFCYENNVSFVSDKVMVLLIIL